MLSVRAEEDGLYEGQNRTVAEEALEVNPAYQFGRCTF